jgi:hypothetical protein
MNDMFYFDTKNFFLSDFSEIAVVLVGVVAAGQEGLTEMQYENLVTRVVYDYRMMFGDIAADYARDTLEAYAYQKDGRIFFKTVE